MLRRFFNLRNLLTLASIGLIVAGVSQLFQMPDRPGGGADDIPSLRERDDLNLVFILIDTLRADRLSSYGYERPTSPVMDALAETGVRFANTNAQSSWTKSSMASLWTATYPVKNRVTRYGHGLPRSVKSPPEILQEAGFRTIGLFRNGWVAANFGFGQGFDLYLIPKALARPQNLVQNNPSAYRLPGTDRDVTEAVGEFLRGVRDERFFLYLHLMDVHQYVYDDSVDFGTRFSDIYDASIRWVDANVGSVVAQLQQHELMRRTVLVIASDHGEAFYEHGIEGHARNLYRETTDVPWIIALPFRLSEPIVVETPVENVDVWPTLLDLMGMPELPGADGRSQVPLIEAAAKGEESGVADASRPRFAHLDQHWGQAKRDPSPLVAVEQDGYRLFYHTRRPEQPELYDLSNDSAEQNNLAAEDPERTASLAGQAEEFLESPPAQWGTPVQVPLSEMQLGQLRALGYMIDNDELPETQPTHPAATPSPVAPEPSEVQRPEADRP